MEFGKGQKQECIKYCEANGLAFFQRDLNATFSKLFIAAEYQEIWDQISRVGPSKSHYYESWSANTPIKLYIDYDKKVPVVPVVPVLEPQAGPSSGPSSPQTSQSSASHKADILNIINCVKEALPGMITDVIILKSIPDQTKKSYHIIFEGCHFPKAKSIQTWLEEQVRPKFKELFDHKLIDTSVYKPSCLRTLLSTKFNQNRPLYLIDTQSFLDNLEEIPVSAKNTNFQQFLKSCITHIPPNSMLINYISKKKKDNSKKVHMQNDEDIYSDKEVVRKYLDILDPERYTDYDKWLKIGFILSSINRNYIDLWHHFSSKWENYNEAETSRKWDTFTNTDYIYTVNNLMYLAKIDNPEDYQEIVKEIPNHDIKYLRPFDNILSKLIHRLYGDNFVCSDCEHSVWYFFNGIRWKKENKSYNLRVLIINEVFAKIENYRRQLVRETASEEIIKNYHTILSKLGSGNRLNCLELEFYNSNFDKIIDQDRNLIGFDNGVYDLVANEFREGRNTDYISMSTEYNYVRYAKDHVLYRELFELICKILPDPEVRDFTLKSLASCLDGHTRDENFYIWSGKLGSGANGKSTLSDLHLKAMGEYACISPVSLITGKRESANSANSALFNLRNKRFVLMQEPAANDQIQVDTLKGFTGGDKISTRELNSSQVSFKLNAKFFICTNRLPGLSGSDGGVSRRIKITEFSSRFVDNPDPKITHIREFKIDRELKSKLDDFTPVFMSILIDYYQLYRKEGLVPPEAVTIVTKKFESDNDLIKQFVQENISSGTSKDLVTRDELKEIFSKDYSLKAHFGKFGSFVTQLESELGTEMKPDPKKKTLRITGFYIRKSGDPDSEDDIDEM